MIKNDTGKTPNQLMMSFDPDEITLGQLLYQQELQQKDPEVKQVVSRCGGCGGGKVL
jgi:hypothetical protein